MEPTPVSQAPASIRLRRIPFRTKITVATSLVLLALLTLTSFWLYSLSSENIIKEMGRELISVTSSGAMDIDGDAFAKLTKPEQMNSPAYLRIQTHLRRLKAANSHIRLRYVYTMAPTDKPGIWRYVVDSADPASEDFSPLGNTEDFNYDPIWKKPLDHPLAEDKLRYYPGWGYLISASSPIRDKAGKPVGIVSVDASAQTVADALRSFRIRALVCGAVGLLLCLILSYALASHLTRPLPLMIAGTRALADGNFNYRVTLDRNDEMGDLIGAFNQMAQGLKEREHYRRQFGQYVSSQIADKLLSAPEKEFQDGQRRKATFIFFDVRGFTSMARRVPPEETMARLNEYLALLTETLFEYGGTLDKFIGEAVLAVFGAPLSQGNDEEKAVHAALAMRKKATELSQRWRLSGYPEFSVGIGLHTGEVLVGNPNSPKRMQYSIVGDAASIATRLEGLNQDYKTQILMSEETYKAVESIVKARLVDTLRIPGHIQPLAVYELLSLK
jgi:adenylate cyclase